VDSPIIIIGAPRSGTNVLRDVLCKLDEVDTWPCDEINYIWRHGNRAYPNDQFPRKLATARIKNYVRAQFAKRSHTPRLVEKTCASSLRVAFVDEIFPNAQYVFIVRNGLDAAVSAMVKSRSSLNLAYLLSKVRFVPVSDIPYYGFRYIASRIQRLASKTKVMRNWGPVPASTLQIAENPTPIQLSAHQWSECVRLSKTQLEGLGQHRYITVRYENFVTNPEVEFTRILEFLNINIPSNLTSILSVVKRDSIGKGQKELSCSEQDSIRTIIHSVSQQVGYQD